MAKGSSGFDVWPLLPQLQVEGGDQTSVSQMQRGQWRVGARLPHFIANWQAITTDPWILQIVSQGLTFQFLEGPPPLTTKPLETPLAGEFREYLVTAVGDLLAKQAVIEIPNFAESPGYYSTYFLTTKKDGSLRPILNLKKFNKYLVKEKFRMETLKQILSTLDMNDWLVSVDLKDAYLHVPIHPEFRHYLRFAFREEGKLRVFQWMVLPFGLHSSPRVFTKILVPVVQHVHSHGHKLSPYIDDLIGASRLTS